jgi:hypothetical protein
MILVQTRHAGLVPASTEPQALGFEAQWTPARGRGDGVLLASDVQKALRISLEGGVG